VAGSSLFALLAASTYRAGGQPKQPPAGPQVLVSVYRDTASFSGLPPVEQISNPKSTCPSYAPALASL
jgi:hypothetical protein